MNLVYLDELCDSISETFDKNTKNIVLINTSDVYNGKVLNHDFVPNENIKGQFKKSFKKEDILYSEIRPANKHFAFVDFDSTGYVASTKLMVLRSKNDKVLPKFLYYLLKSKEVVNFLQGLAESRSGTFPQITFSELSTIEINLPSIKNQEIIVAIIDNIENKILNREKIYEDLEILSQNLFKKWFVNFQLDNDFGIREDKKDSSLGKIPESWNIKTIGDLCEVKGRIGWRGYTTNDLVDDGPWVVGGKEITLGFIDFSTAKHLTREKYEESPEIMLKDKDLIIAKTGTIGPIAMFYESYGEATLNPNVGLIRSKNISSALLLTFFKTPRVQYFLNEFTTSSVQPAINQKTIKQLNIAIPSDNKLLQKISEVFEEINELQYNLIEEIKKLGLLRDTILPKLMSGEIDLS